MSGPDSPRDVHDGSVKMIAVLADLRIASSRSDLLILAPFDRRCRRESRDVQDGHMGRCVIIWTLLTGGTRHPNYHD